MSLGVDARASSMDGLSDVINSGAAPILLYHCHRFLFLLDTLPPISLQIQNALQYRPEPVASTHSPRPKRGRPLRLQRQVDTMLLSTNMPCTAGSPRQCWILPDCAGSRGCRVPCLQEMQTRAWFGGQSSRPSGCEGLRSHRGSNQWRLVNLTQTPGPRE